jgi:ribonuclease HI
MLVLFVPLIRRCQKALNDIATQLAVGLYWVPGHAGVRGNEIADRLTRSGSVQRFVEPESLLGVSRQNIRRNIKSWMEKQYLVL